MFVGTGELVPEGVAVAVAVLVGVKVCVDVVVTVEPEEVVVGVLVEVTVDGVFGKTGGKDFEQAKGSKASPKKNNIGICWIKFFIKRLPEEKKKVKV